MKSTVDGAAAEAETIEVTTFTDDAGTVVVEPAIWDSTCDETDSAIEEESDDWTDDVAALVVEKAVDEVLPVDVAGAAMVS